MLNKDLQDYPPFLHLDEVWLHFQVRFVVAILSLLFFHSTNHNEYINWICKNSTELKPFRMSYVSSSRNSSPTDNSLTELTISFHASDIQETGQIKL